MSTFSDPRPIIFDSEGKPVLSGRVYFYEAGTVDILKAIYADHLLVTGVTNPVPLDANGRVPQLYYGAGPYKIRVQKQTGFLPPPDDVWANVWTCDWVDGGSISTVLASGGLLSYANNLATLRAMDPTTAPVVTVLGNTNSGDGGGGIYQWAGTISNADDNGVYIQRAGGGSGRYVRLPDPAEDGVSLKVWCGSSTAPIDTAYAAASAYCAVNRIPLRFAAGTYKFADSITMSGTNLSLVIDDLANFKMSVAGTITISAPCKIKSASSLFSDSTLTNIIFSPSAGITAIDNRWWTKSYDCAYSAGLQGWPVVLKVPTTISVGPPEAHRWTTEYTAGLIVEAGCTTITIPDGNTSWLNVFCPMIVEGPERRIFTESDIDHTSVTRISLGDFEHKSKADKVHAWWWGYGYFTTADQSLPLSRAMFACNEAYSTPLYIGYTPSTKYISDNVDPIDAGGVPLPVYITTPINITTGGSIGMIAPLNGLSEHLFNMSGGDLGRVQATVMSPEWFGCKITATDNRDNLMYAVGTGMVNRVPLDGGGLTYKINSGISITGLTTDYRISIRNITIEPRTPWAGTILLITSADGGGDVFLDNVILGSILMEDTLSSLYLRTYYFNINSGTIFGAMDVQGEDYRVTNLQQYGVGVSIASFGSAKVSGLVSGCTFSNSAVRLAGDNAVKSGRTLHMLENIRFVNNVCENVDHGYNTGVVYMAAQKPGTLITGVQITGNEFSGNIRVPNPVVSGITWQRLRIRDKWEGTGNWQTSISQFSSSGTLRYYHSFIIKNNITGTTSGNKGATDVTLYDQENWCPSTSGTYEVIFDITHGTSDLYSGYITPVVTPTQVAPVQYVFSLTGDTKTCFQMLNTTPSFGIVSNYAYRQMRYIVDGNVVLYNTPNLGQAQVGTVTNYYDSPTFGGIVIGIPIQYAYWFPPSGLTHQGQIPPLPGLPTMTAVVGLTTFQIYEQLHSSNV